MKKTQDMVYESIFFIKLVHTLMRKLTMTPNYQQISLSHSTVIVLAIIDFQTFQSRLSVMIECKEAATTSHQLN